MPSSESRQVRAPSGRHAGPRAFRSSTIRAAPVAMSTTRSTSSCSYTNRRPSGDQTNGEIGTRPPSRRGCRPSESASTIQPLVSCGLALSSQAR